ncbi:MAG: Hint domain-containing protein [Pseudomonadota bacterium]
MAPTDAVLRGGIVINEVLVDPNSTSANFDTNQDGAATAGDEFVEIANISGVPIDIGGLQLWDEGRGNWFTIPDGTVLPAGASLAIATGDDAGATVGQNILYAGLGDSGVLNNGGDNLVLFDPLADSFVQATYNGDAAEDPTSGFDGFSATATRIGPVEVFGSDTDGQSIQRSPDGDTATVVGDPTPGAANLCFTAGTWIATPDGERLIETLRPGDLILTRDGDPQPLRWIGRRQVAATGRRAPVCFAPGALGQRRALIVSQQHRMLLGGWRAELLFGAAEVLVPAVHLINDEDIQLCEGGNVTYIHLLFDHHQIVTANGIASESFHPGEIALSSLTTATRAEILSLFPELAERNIGYGPVARPVLKGFEAHVLQRAARTLPLTP